MSRTPFIGGEKNFAPGERHFRAKHRSPAAVVAAQSRRSVPDKTVGFMADLAEADGAPAIAPKEMREGFGSRAFGGGQLIESLVLRVEAGARTFAGQERVT